MKTLLTVNWEVEILQGISISEISLWQATPYASYGRLRAISSYSPVLSYSYELVRQAEWSAGEAEDARVRNSATPA
jgi:hypothetical protein